jgi:hypothetical protein
MGFLDRAKKMVEKAGPLIDKAAPHAQKVVDKAGQEVDKRTGGKYHDKLEQVETKVGEYADKRMAANGTAPAGTSTADDGFPATPPPVTTPAPAVDNGEPNPTETSAPVPPAAADTDGPTTRPPGDPAPGPAGGLAG